MRREFTFNTGVVCRGPGSATPVRVPGSRETPNGVQVIPFECDDVPEGAVFKHACDHPVEDEEGLICREIHNSTLVSKYAFFQVPVTNENQ